MYRIIPSETPLPEIIREGRSVTANIRTERGPTRFSGLDGLNEFWQCVKSSSPSLEQAKACLPYLEDVELDVFSEKKIPVQLKPDWIWFAAGFLAAWILKR